MATRKSSSDKPKVDKKSAVKKKKPINKSVKKASKAAKPAKKRSTRPKISKLNRITMVQEAAYFIALNRNFEAGNELEDWLAAEKQVNKLI